MFLISSKGEVTDRGFRLRSGQLWERVLKFLELKPGTNQSHVIEILKQRQPEARVDRILKRGQRRSKRFSPNEPPNLSRMKLQQNGSVVAPVKSDRAYGPVVLPRKNITLQNHDLFQQNVKDVDSQKEDHLPVDVQKVVFESEKGKPNQNAQNVVNLGQALEQPAANINEMGKREDQDVEGPDGGKLKNLFFGKSDQEKANEFNVPEGPARQLLQVKADEYEETDFMRQHHEVIEMNIPIIPDGDSSQFSWEKSGLLVDLQKVHIFEINN